MGLDIGGNQITQASSVLTVNTGASMKILSAGGVVRPQQIQFTAVGNPALGWVYLAPPESSWNKMPFTTATINVNGCYNTSLSRFTAPVSGWYFFQAGNGHLLKDLVSDGYYFHPMFWVNGSASGGVVNTAYGNYRLRGYGQNIATYNIGHITQLYALNAGDYVEYYLYSNGGWNGANGNRYYVPYGRFTGLLLG